MWEWHRKLQKRKVSPTAQQLNILETVILRILQERDDEIAAEVRPRPEAPLCGLVHGLPGTGKSEIIKWIRELFTTILQWEHGIQFFCVTYQNKTAAAIGGFTLHSAAGLTCRQVANKQTLTCTDKQNLFARTQNLRWILMDEISMISTSLLASFEGALRRAARTNSPYTYARTKNGQRLPRLCGGYNLLFFGDWWQLQPMDDSAALFRPPAPTDFQEEKDTRNIFWARGASSLNRLWELTEQKRCEDPWYHDILLAMRPPLSAE